MQLREKLIFEYSHPKRGASGWRARNCGSMAYWLQALGLYFIVHEPSG